MWPQTATNILFSSTGQHELRIASTNFFRPATPWHVSSQCISSHYMPNVDRSGGSRSGPDGFLLALSSFWLQHRTYSSGCSGRETLSPPHPLSPRPRYRLGSHHFLRQVLCPRMIQICLDLSSSTTSVCLQTSFGISLATDQTSEGIQDRINLRARTTCNIASYGVLKSPNGAPVGHHLGHAMS